MTRPLDRVLVLLGHKLIGTDSILPLLLELQRERPGLDVRLLLVNEAWRPVIEANYVLMAAVQRLGGLYNLSDGRGGTGRIKAGIRLVRWLVWLRSRPSLLLGYGDFAPFPYNLLAGAARSGGGCVALHVKPPYPFNPALRAAQFDKLTGDHRFTDPGDRFLVFHPAQAEDYRPFVDREPCLVGTPRRYPAWLDHLDRMGTEVLDWEGRPIDFSGPTLLASYPGPAKTPTLRRNPRELFLDFLKVLSETAPQVRLVVKPHPICDLDMMRRDFAAFDRLDLRVSFSHPQILARKVTAAVFPHGSSIIDDMYVGGLPVLDLCEYVDGIGEGGLFPNAGRLDCSTPQALRQALALVADAPESLPRPQVDHLVWPKPDRVSDLVLAGADR